MRRLLADMECGAYDATTSEDVSGGNSNSALSSDPGGGAVEEVSLWT